MFTLLDRHIDVFIPSYPGWKTLLSVLEAISKGQQWRNHNNTICVDPLRNRFIINKMEADLTSINEDELDWKLAYSTNKEYFTFNSQSIEFGRGCPLHCSFCDFRTSNITNKEYDTFVRELESISSLPFITHLRFTDENLFSSKRKLEVFTKAMLNFEGRFTWDSTSTSLIHLDDEAAEKLAKTGCIYLESSMESGDKNLLKNHINKHIYPERFLENVSILNKHNIDTRISFIVCHPGETSDSINNTLNVVREIPRDGPGINYVEFHKFFLSLDTAYLNSSEGRRKYDLHGVSFKWKTKTWNYKKAEEVFQEIVESIEYPSTVNNILIKKELAEFKTRHYYDLLELLKYAHKLTVAQYRDKQIQQVHYADRIRDVLVNKLLPDYKTASEQ
ncbi:B12-binding domain-containing radical SAM protein [Candidatus Thiosymbion oneisti]|nr:radical SAM protein [Candidatus Thiosymbion oneisti]